METQVHVHNQAKQTETSEFGTEKGLLQGQQVDGMSYALKTSGSQKGFGKAFLKARCEFRCVCVCGRVAGSVISLCTVLIH